MDMAFNSLGNIYIPELGYDRITKKDSSGKTIITQWGSYGPGDGQFRFPYSVAVDSEDNVYVTDKRNNRIQKFNSSGECRWTRGEFGTGDGQFNRPGSIAVNSAGNVYVADGNNNRIQIFGDYALDTRF